MPIRPSTIVYTCPKCHWSKTVAPRSDALMPGDHYSACPACGHAPVSRRQADAAQAALAQLLQKIRRILP